MFFKSGLMKKVRFWHEMVLFGVLTPSSVIINKKFELHGVDYL